MLSPTECFCHTLFVHRREFDSSTPKIEIKPGSFGTRPAESQDRILQATYRPGFGNFASNFFPGLRWGIRDGPAETQFCDLQTRLG